MSVAAFTDGYVAYAALALGGLSNTIKLSTSVDPLDVTTFGSETGKSKVNLSGLIEWGVSVDGFMNPTDPAFDATVAITAWDQIQAAAKPASVAQARAFGSTAYLGYGVLTSLTQFGKIGEVCPFALEIKTAGDLARGQVLWPPTAATVNGTTSNGTASQMGTVTSAQTIWMAVHLIAISGGTSVQFKLQTDNAGGFGSPTTIITGSALTTAGGPTSALSSVAGPSTDDYFRVTATTVGNVTFTAFVTVGWE